METALQSRTLSSFLLALQHNWKNNNKFNSTLFKLSGWSLLRINPRTHEHPKIQPSGLPDDSVCTDNELRFGVPLVVGDVVMGLQPNPLLTFGQEAIVAGFTLSKLHY